jgi:ferredoxin-NADP reductase
MPLPWQNGKVIRIENETKNTRRYWIEIPGVESFDFEPGQFVTLDFPIDERPARRRRSYSIASWPDGTNVIELVIVLLEGGAGTHYLFNQIDVGSELTLRGPLGVFTLPKPIDRDLFFICTGTGIAPFRSMAHYIFNHQIEHQDIYLIFGCRKFEDALYREEMEELDKKMKNFHYIPTFSREIPGDINRLVRTGYVHAVYEEICNQKATVKVEENLRVVKPAHFFLCGWKAMIDEAKQRIMSLGFDRKSIHQELYG